MKTLLSVNSYYYRRDGSEVVYLGHNELFQRQGWRVVPFAMRHPQNLPSEWSSYFATDVEFGENYSLWQKLRRVPKVIYSLEARRSIQQLLKKTTPNICHLHSIYHHLSPSILGAIHDAGVPAIMTLHDLKIACPAYHMYNQRGICESCKDGGIHQVVKQRCIKNSLALSSVIYLEGLLHKILDSYGRHIDRFVSPCQFYIDKLVAWGWPRERFVHIPNFVDVDSSASGHPVGQSFLYFGRLSAEKGLHTLIRAAKAAGVGLRLAGHGPDEAGLRELAERLQADVKFLGHLDTDRLRDEILASRATVLAAEWYENNPMSILESFALARPVIGADIGGIPELIEHEETGWLFPSGSVEALAETLAAVMRMPSSRIEEMGAACQRAIEQNFSSARYVERITALYASLGVR
ncbi:glycosyltransferase family 4 protein [Methyloterricola oryzae]|uniref:glycosyltransferase family 4 protein n=1 Tax=Methyloterricola oryzae TaxID=1495050 RepID=UPI0005EADE9F|nr:glycosyltransferase family 4 protein [Methyloterricola oryzae]